MLFAVCHIIASFENLLPLFFVFGLSSNFNFSVGVPTVYPFICLQKYTSKMSSPENVFVSTSNSEIHTISVCKLSLFQTHIQYNKWNCFRFFVNATSPLCLDQFNVWGSKVVVSDCSSVIKILIFNILIFEVTGSQPLMFVSSIALTI